MANQGKKPGSARTRKVASLKMKTQTSDVDSEFPQHNDTETKDPNSKLSLIEKSQQDIND